MPNLPFLKGMLQADPNGIMSGDPFLDALQSVFSNTTPPGSMPQGFQGQPPQPPMMPQMGMQGGMGMPGMGMMGQQPGMGMMPSANPFADSLAKGATGGLFDLSKVFNAAHNNDPDAINATQQIDPGIIELLKQQLQSVLQPPMGMMPPMPPGGPMPPMPPGPPQGR
jgi:hypothetical protein